MYQCQQTETLVCCSCMSTTEHHVNVSGLISVSLSESYGSLTAYNASPGQQLLATPAPSHSGGRLEVLVMEDEHVRPTLFTFILSLHWDGVLSYPSSDKALDTRSYMAGPGALPENTVPATSSCCILASVSLSLPHTAMRAFVSDGVHDIPRQAVKLLEDEAAVRPAVPEPTFKGEKRLGVEELEWY